MGGKFSFLFEGGFYGVAVRVEMGKREGMSLRGLMIEARKWDLIDGLSSDVRVH